MKRLVFRIAHLVGVNSLSRLFRRNRLTILLYHGVAPSSGTLFNYRGKFISPKAFEKQIAYLSSHYTILPLDKAVEFLYAGKLPKNPLVITFDDGYRNVYEHGFPILRKYSAPATVFLPTNFVFGNEPLWVDRLEYALEHSTKISDVREKRILDNALRQELKRLPEDQKKLRLDEIEPAHGARLAQIEQDDRYAALSSTMIHEMQTGGITFGAHTKSHPILANVPPENLQDEIVGSYEILKARFSDVSRVFCYPNGQKEDWTPEVGKVLESSDFTSALTTQSGSNTKNTARFHLKRFTMDNTENRDEFLAAQSGLRGLLQTIVLKMKSRPAEADKKKVLVLGENNRATLSVVRSLGRDGLQVDIATEHTRAPVCRSRYVSEVYALPSENGDVDKYIEAVCRLVRNRQYSLLLPTTESTIIPVLKNRERLEKFVRCALPSSESFAFTFDKAKTAQLAAELDIPVPHSTVITSLEEFDASRFTKFPVAVKPLSSRVLYENTYIGRAVSIARDKDSLLRAVLDGLFFGPILVQEYFEGSGVGQEFLAQDGNILLTFEHHRMREHTGSGASTLRVSAPVHPGMLEASRKLIERMRWTGVIMMEYRLNAQGEFALIEMNGRFWGSLATPEHAGVDFPKSLYHLLVLNKVPALQQSYKRVMVRDIVADMKLFARTHSRIALFAEGLRALIRLLTAREHWDVAALDDPRPMLAEFWRLAVKALRTSSPTLWQGSRAKIEPAKRVLFICQGNINRSAFAQEYLRKKLRTTGKEVEVRSAGLYDRPNRPSPLLAQETASTYEVSLAKHHSRTLTQDLADWADIIFCMDAENMRSMREMYPNAAVKVHPLSAMTDDRDIQDPDGRDREVYADVFRRIAGAIDAYAKLY